MASFVYNFTFNQLERSQLSSTLKHKFKCDEDTVCMLELNADNYEDMTDRADYTYLVIHYSHHCGACSSIAGVFLACQKLLSGVSDLIFARIDVSKNTLPWHLTFNTVPTIVFHPRNRKSYSRVFNPYIPITVKSLMNFILTGLPPTERSTIALSLCNPVCMKSMTSRAIFKRLKIINAMNMISSKLKQHNDSFELLELELVHHPERSHLRSKLLLLHEVKQSLSRKLAFYRSQLSHLKEIINSSPVPLNFSDLLPIAKSNQVK